MNNGLFLIYNVMTGSGFKGGAYGGEWISAWISLSILGVICFFGFILSKNDNIPFPYSFAGSLIGPLIALIIIAFTASSKIALVVGLVGLLAGAYFAGQRGIR